MAVYRDFRRCISHYTLVESHPTSFSRWKCDPASHLTSPGNRYVQSPVPTRLLRLNRHVSRYAWMWYGKRWLHNTREPNRITPKETFSLCFHFHFSSPTSSRSISLSLSLLSSLFFTFFLLCVFLVFPFSTCF